MSTRRCFLKSGAALAVATLSPSSVPLAGGQQQETQAPADLSQRSPSVRPTRQKPTPFETEFTQYLANRSKAEALSLKLQSPRFLGTQPEIQRAAGEIRKAREKLRASVAAADARFAPRHNTIAEEFDEFQPKLDRSRLKEFFDSQRRRRLPSLKWPSSQKPLVIDPSKIQTYTVGLAAPCEPEYLEGIAGIHEVQTSTLTTPNDSDSEEYLNLQYLIEYSKNTIEHRAYIDDQTHWYSNDDNEQYAYWFALGYRIPKVPCDGMLFWGLFGRHHLKLTGDAEYRYLYTNWLQYPPYDQQEWQDREPNSLDDFTRWVGVEFTNNFEGYDKSGSWSREKSDSDLPFLGWLKVKAGDRVKVWLGVYVFLSGREGTSKTGWNHFRVWTEDYDLNTIPGILYSFQAA